ncbi:hypothetical protein M5689_013407 [Euphorbia peplus]|nr:hypothetical protein M5689_013407 [Euphorbia peplus]
MIMSSEEANIWRELEMDIENDLEQEIKDGIYKLALRLHSLYQHQNQRLKNIEENNYIRRKKMLAEVNISIILEGGVKIEIKESKKEVKIKRASSATSESKSSIKSKSRFDWASSLRSGSGQSSATTNFTRQRKISHAKGLELAGNVLIL